MTPYWKTIRLLSDFETSHTKLLEIVLAWPTSIGRQAARPNLSQLRRQAHRGLGQVGTLERRGDGPLYRARLRVAGPYGRLFSSHRTLLALIAERSQGIPRNINNICFSALMLGHSRDARQSALILSRKWWRSWTWSRSSSAPSSPGLPLSLRVWLLLISRPRAVPDLFQHHMNPPILS